MLAIGIALRALLPGRAAHRPHAGRGHRHGAPPPDRPRLAVAAVEQIRAVADGLPTRNCDLDPVRALLDRLEGELLPHERADEDELMPLVARALGGPATATMSRTHAEIEHQVSRLRRLLDGIDPDHVEPEDVIELRRLLYGLYAVCRLHNARRRRAPSRSSPRSPPRPAASVGTTRPADPRCPTDILDVPRGAAAHRGRTLG